MSRTTIHRLTRWIMIGLLLQANFVLADIFRVEDPNGRVSYTDNPIKGAERVASPTTSSRYRHTVKYVYDGDSIVLHNGERVRLIGVNAPEIESRYRKGEPGGQQAAKWLKKKLAKATVLLEYDAEKTDKYDRSLAYVFLDNGDLINQSIIESGLATVSIVPPNSRYAERLIKAEQSAQAGNLGIWAMKRYQTVPVANLAKRKKVSGWHRITAIPKKLTHTKKYSRFQLTPKVDVRIPRSNTDLFSDLESYIDQRVEIRGWVTRSKGRYSILIRHPSALIKLD